MSRKVRIGIDVGGTFTDAVILDHITYEILAKQKIPTTHEKGVAVGVVQIISTLMQENGIAPEDVVFIAHGTTQATNALLEGDVANVGIVGMATGMDAPSAKNDTAIGSIELAPGKFLKADSIFIDSKKLTEQSIDDAISSLLRRQSQVIVASEAFSVDNPEHELWVMDRAATKGAYATGGHEISQLYGLKMRTRTAVINASLIPKMMETANMTENAVHDAHIDSNLMIMRCDGGVMSIGEVRKRPILTMLSGLAAGVAGALMYEKVSDGIFFEVGGTSIDISVIKNGKVIIKYAEVGGFKTYLRSLDVRTYGVAGGSMIRVSGKAITDVGPRSAHIAGLEYECFTEDGQISDAALQLISPRPDDPNEYATVRAQDGKVYSLTLAGAANLLGYVPEGDYAYSHAASCNKIAWQALGTEIGVSAEVAARQAMNVAMKKLVPIVNDLINEYQLDSNLITLVGGGGSAAVVVCALSDAMGIRWKIAENAPYISTIGVALAMVQEQVERTIPNPTNEDIKRIRAEAINRIVQSGAKEQTVDVTIEIDSQRNIVRAVATGATEFRQKDLNLSVLPMEQLADISAKALGVPHVSQLGQTGRWIIFEGTSIKPVLFGLMKVKTKSLVVIDREGVVRLKKNNAQYLKFAKSESRTKFAEFINANTSFSSGNAVLPRVFVFFAEKMLDLTGMQTNDQMLSILEVEIEFLPEDTAVIAVAYL